MNNIFGYTNKELQDYFDSLKSNKNNDTIKFSR